MVILAFMCVVNTLLTSAILFMLVTTIWATIQERSRVGLFMALTAGLGGALALIFALWFPAYIIFCEAF